MNDMLIKLVIPGGTLAAAGMVGMMLMEQSNAPAQLAATQQTAANLEVTEVVETAAPTDFEPRIPFAPEATQVPVQLRLPTTPNSVSNQTPVATILPDGETVAPITGDAASDPSVVSDDACPVDLSVRARAAAMLTVDVMAPCSPNARLEVRHAGMVVTTTTTDDGMALVNLAALETPARVFVGLPDGTGAKARVDVDDLADYRRVIINQALAVQDVELHILEGEADYGSDGHLHPSNPRTIAHALAGNGGFMTFMGDPGADDPRMALAYTFPRDAQDIVGRPSITLEVPVSKVNCGTDRKAVAFQTVWGQDVEVFPLELALPECDAVGEWLIVPNLFETESLAENR